MSAYTDLNGVPATGNKWLLTDVLRNMWGFEGFVVSDAMSVRDLKTHDFAQDFAGAGVRAFQAGVNIEMSFGKAAYTTALPDALASGQITYQQLDDAVRPILEAQIRLGLFKHPFVDEAAAATVLWAPDHKTDARIAAERSAVLLRNEGGLLPLKATNYHSIAVLGAMASSKPDTNGSWSFASDVEETVTVLDGLKASFGSTAEVRYAPGVRIARKFPSIMQGIVKGIDKSAPWTEEEADREFMRAVKLAADSDIAVMVLGESQDMSGEAASRSSLDLPGRQEQLLEAVVASGKPVVLVLLNGRPLNLTWASTHVPAILDAWYPGDQGGPAVANLLLGKAVPGGKLPFTWPRSVGQVPMFYAHDITHSPSFQARRYWDEESTPLYPFGFGLSYATFAVSDLHLDKPAIAKGQGITASVQVENTSEAVGEEVAQLYIHQQYGTRSRPVRELKGFQRIALAPHQKRTLRFTLSPDDLTYWSAATHTFLQDATTFDVWVGDVANAQLHADFKINGAAH